MKKRVFISIELTNSLKKKISQLLRGVGDQGLPLKLVPQSNFHITLKYLGYLDASQLREINSDLVKLRKNTKPFIIKLTRVVLIPDSKWARVAAIAVEENENLLALHARLIKILATHKYIEIYTRNFKPHLTISRIKKRGLGYKRSDELKQYKIVQSLVVRKISLMESILSDGEANYKCLKNYSFTE